MKKHIVLALCAILFASSAAHAEDLIVIANKNVALTSVTRAELQNIFLGKTLKWPDGKRIKIVVLREGGTHTSFLNEMLGKSTSAFDTYWKQVIFTGKGRPPKTVDYEEEIVQYVSATDGAIGYIDSGTAHADVLMIEVK